MKLAKSVLTAAVFALAAALALPAARAVTWEVEIEDFVYTPGNLQISVGDVVEWRNRDSVPHTATSDDGVFDSGILQEDDTFTYTFTEAGTFPYHCTVHPFMVDTITVTGPSAIGDEGIQMPSQFEIAQSYPNPFNAATTIGFSLGVAGQVKLEIYNLIGQKIETLLNEYMSAGDHSVIWNASGRQSGVFFYRVTVDGQSKTGRMVLLK